MRSEDSNAIQNSSSMSFLSKVEVYPKNWRTTIDIDLRELLEEALSVLGMDKAYMGFIDQDGNIHYPAALRMQTDTFGLDMPYYEGLVGLAIVECDVFCWPDDPGTECRMNNDPKARTEIAGPLQYRDKPTGTMWFASHDENKRLKPADKATLSRYIRQIDTLLKENATNWTEGVDKKLQDLAELCLIETRSDRGYIAVATSENDFKCFYAGKDQNLFLPLTPFEGICGRAFQEKEIYNCEDVFKDTSYLPSHADVRSELVIPIVDDLIGTGRQSIGLINMESYHKNHFKSLEKVHLSDLADCKARRLARTYRQWKSSQRKDSVDEIYEHAMNGLIGFVQATDYAKSHEQRLVEGDSAFKEALLHCAKQMTGAPHSVWWDKDEEPPVFWTVIDVSDETPLSEEGLTRLAVRLRDEGEKIGVLGIEFNEPNINEELMGKLLKSAARLGAALFKLTRRADRDARIVSLVQLAVDSPDDPQTIIEVVRSLPMLLESRYCTVFLRVELNGRKYLVPGPTSHGELTPTSPSRKAYYDWVDTDGPTGYAAVRNTEVFIPNLANEQDRNRFSNSLVWKRILAEEPGSETNAFLARPIRSPFDDNEVIGVIRTFRDKISPRTSYAEYERKTFALFAFLLGKAVHSLLTNYPPCLFSLDIGHKIASGNSNSRPDRDT